MTDKHLECPVFRPTLEHVRHLTFSEYVSSIEPQWLHIGICRIVAPDGWTPRRGGYNDLDNVALPRPIRQHATGRQGLYRTLLVEQRSLSLGAFKALTDEPNNAPPSTEPETLERKFWKNIPMNPPLYGADVPGSLFDERVRGWNLKHLNSILSRTLEENDAAIPGVTQPYLYAGSWRSFFAWHTEDLDLHSVNYIHTGAPKTWYVIPPAARERFELVTTDLLPELSRSCPEFLRHKEIMLSPALLAAHNIPVVKTVHNPREFVVVGPGAYHAGFNHGYNLAESVNFATPAWVPIGARASFCTCRPDSVKIDMRLFSAHMSAELAEEVRESYRSESEEEEEEGEEESDDEGEEESGEEEEEEVEVEEGVGAASNNSSDSEESGSESEEEEEEEEELPAKRVRRPTEKARLNGMAKIAKIAKTAAPLRPATASKATAAVQRSKGKPLPLQKQQQHQQQQQQRAKARRPARKLTASRRQQTSSAAGAAPSAARKQQQQQQLSAAAQRKQRRERAENALHAAAVAHVHASSESEDDETVVVGGGGGGGGGGSRTTSKRGAAKAWYRLFDSLLPALKRART